MRDSFIGFNFLADVTFSFQSNRKIVHAFRHFGTLFNSQWAQPKKANNNNYHKNIFGTISILKKKKKKQMRTLNIERNTFFVSC